MSGHIEWLFAGLRLVAGRVFPTPRTIAPKLDQCLEYSTVITRVYTLTLFIDVVSLFELCNLKCATMTSSFSSSGRRIPLVVSVSLNKSFFLEAAFGF